MILGNALLSATLLAASATASINGHSHIRRSRHHQQTRSLKPAPAYTPWAKRNTTFQLSDHWAGSNFFDGFDFYTDSDPTHGYVNFVDEDTAWNQSLVSTTSTQAIIKVDDTTNIPSGQNRNSVRIGTKKTYDGALFVLDIATMPTGCATWPAFWTVSATEDWPNGGEIDIIEGVNKNTQNQMTLHTSAGCEPDTPSSAYTGQQLGTTCASSDGSNAGCGFLDSGNASYGAPLNQAGGGVFAMHWDGGGVSIWHFTHGDDLPCDLEEQSENPDPSTWGTPAATWVADGCSPYTYLHNHQAIIETTLCGDWAGSAYTNANSGCSGTCADFVATGSNFQDAVWTINYFSVFLES